MKTWRWLWLAWLAGGVLGAAWAGEGNFNTGAPFGRIGEREVNGLMARASKDGLDLAAEMRRAYDNDDAALARVFAYGLKFTKLDRDARAYGQIIYSAFLNLSERRGVEAFSRLVAAQPAPVRQRIRDFLFYDVTQAPRAVRAEAEKGARESAPLLFPADYVFGRDDPIFARH